MKRFFIACAILLGLTAPTGAQSVGGQQIVCDSVFQVSQGAVALTEIVAAEEGKQISLCGWAFNTGVAEAAVQLQYGTGTDCGTGTTPITPAVALEINGDYVDHIPYAFFSLPRDNNLCLVTTGAGSSQVMVYYGIF